jgi:hypothetical protein
MTPRGWYRGNREAGRLDVRSVDERVMRTATFLALANAVSRGIVVSSGHASTLARVLDEDRRRPAVNKSVTLA